jgi:hypothetical protein
MGQVIENAKHSSRKWIFDFDFDFEAFLTHSPEKESFEDRAFHAVHASLFD